jgi:hypothetical protein
MTEQVHVVTDLPQEKNSRKKLALAVAAVTIVVVAVAAKVARSETFASSEDGDAETPQS